MAWRKGNGEWRGITSAFCLLVCVLSAVLLMLPMPYGGTADG